MGLAHIHHFSFSFMPLCYANHMPNDHALIYLPNLENRSEKLTLTPEKATKIVSAIAKGSSRAGAANLAGISEATFRDWIDWANEKQEEPYITLLSHVLMAEADLEAHHASSASKAARLTDEHLKFLKSHPLLKERWGGSDDSKGITVQIGFKFEAK